MAVDHSEAPPSHSKPTLTRSATVAARVSPQGEYWITDQILGVGSTGKVMLAVRRTTNLNAAVKIIGKKSKCKEEALREIRLLLQLNHKNIVRIERIEESEASLFIFMEHYDAGDLFTFIQDRGPLREDVARHMFVQMCEALKYCHRHRICHHDFKLENCVISRRLELGLIDFGYAMIVPEGDLIRKFPGSPAYAAPAVLFRQPHTMSVDIFSLGTSLYYMLSGQFPFCDEEKSSFAELCRNVASFDLRFAPWMSDDARDLIRRMLARERRIGWDDIAKHPWLRRPDPTTLQVPASAAVSAAADTRPAAEKPGRVPAFPSFPFSSSAPAVGDSRAPAAAQPRTAPAAASVPALAVVGDSDMTIDGCGAIGAALVTASNSHERVPPGSPCYSGSFTSTQGMLAS